MARYKRVIVDAMNLTHRAFHTTARELGKPTEDDDYANNVEVSRLPAPDGMSHYPTGVLYVCLRTYAALLRRWIPDQVIFVWDNNSRSSWRSRSYANYKSTRRARADMQSDEEKMRRAAFIEKECKDVRNMVAGLGGINLDAPDGYEADDVISFLCRRLTCADNTSNLIVSTDKDLVQLVRRYQTQVFAPVSSALSTSLYSQHEKTGAVHVLREDDPNLSGEICKSPLQYLLERSLIGDKTDDIPGVPRIGAATAGVIATAIITLASQKKANVHDFASYLHDKNADAIDACADAATRQINGVAVTKRVANLARMLCTDSQARDALVLSYTLSDLHTPLYQAHEAANAKTLSRVTRQYVEALKAARALTCPSLAKSNESLACNFARYFGVRGFKLAYDDEAREAIGIEAMNMHRRNNAYIRVLAPHARDAWRRWV